MSSESSSSRTPPGDNVLKILVTTDNHLGFGEKDPVRGEDSFTAFEECLQHALDNEVDFILLGGDLFHDSNPSANSLHKCLKLLRRYTLGDKPIEFEIVNSQDASVLECLQANFEDPNMNISIPVFSIHGNHDDPSGFGRLSSLDILSTTGLVNYFGKWSNLDRININPIMIKKADTKLALFGLSHIYDTRLVRLFADYKVTLEKPDDSWFNLMVLHQNRADRGPKNYLPEDILPSFLDLIIWGHEHDCRIEPEQNELKNFFVSQPGSTTPTSLSEGEAIDKHCGLLLIRENQFRLEPIKLKTVRPFIFDSMNLADNLYQSRLNLKRLDVQEQVKKIVAEKVEEMLELAKEKLTGHPKQPTEPIIRLRVQFENEEQIFNSIRFGQGYVGRVANHNDMILRHKQVKKRDEIKPLDKGVMQDILKEEKSNKQVRVVDIVGQYFETVGAGQQLKVLSPVCMGEIMRRLVESEDFHSADFITDFHVERANKFLKEKKPEEDETLDCLGGFQESSRQTLRDAIEALENSGVNEVTESVRQKFLESVGKGSTRNGSGTTVEIKDDDDDDEDDDDDVVLISSTSVKGKAPKAAAKPRAARGAKTRGSTRGKAAAPATSSRRKAEPLELSIRSSSRATKGNRSKFFDDSESE